jgi:hypothetical protein
VRARWNSWKVNASQTAAANTNDNLVLDAAKKDTQG